MALSHSRHAVRPSRVAPELRHPPSVRRALCVRQSRRVTAYASAEQQYPASEGTASDLPVIVPPSRPEDAFVPESDVVVPPGRPEDAYAVQSRPESSGRQDFKVFVAGSTGGVGRRVVEQLFMSNVKVRALARDTAKASNILKGVGTTTEVVQGDVYQFTSLPRALADANAIIICTGANNIRNPLGPFEIDYQGTKNLIALAQQKKVKKVVLISSIGADELLNPLNLFWGVLFWKKRAEEELQRSGLDYTIIRPGGLKNQLRAGELRGNIVMNGPGYYGLGESGSILRDQVAEVAVAALMEPAAKNKVVEVIAKPDAPRRSMKELFEQIWQ